MKGDLKTAFETVRGSIFHEPMRMARVQQGYHVLVDIMRDANHGKGGFDAEAIRSQGIDPREFIKALAFTYAQATLEYHDGQSAFQEVLVARCNTCLKTEDEYSFGHHLAEDVKLKIQDKLARNDASAPAFHA